MVIPSTSTEYVYVDVTAPAGTDLTGTPVKIAVVEHAEPPATADWQPAEWVADAARLLIGPGGGALTLARGSYRVWIAVDPPGAESIVRRSGTITIA